MDMRDMLLLHCREVLEKRPSCLPAMSAIAYLTLADLVKGIYTYVRVHVCTCMWTNTFHTCTCTSPDLGLRSYACFHKRHAAHMMYMYMCASLFMFKKH